MAIQHIKRWDSVDEVNLSFSFNVLEIFLSFKMTSQALFIKIDQGIHILQLKKDSKF